MGQSWSAPKRPMNSIQLLGSKQVPYVVAYEGAWYGMLVLAGTLLTLCALLAGLTLGVCGLNMTFLQLRGITGTPKQRQQALIVARMKRHHSWMLCSLIILSVFCGESLPFVIQSLWNDSKQWWVPVIVSTLSIAIFAEIAPQYWVPRRAVEWGYYCRPLIWGCMWVTCIVSWPLAKLLDYCSGGNDDVSIFSRDELAALIQYHEQIEENRGTLEHDTSRVMLGALALNGHKIGAILSTFPETRIPISTDRESDLEKADLVVANDMIKQWSAVKTVDIDELVDKDFINKVKSWSHSRIPVVGKIKTFQAANGKNHSNHSSWQRKVFGVLHVKNLVGLKISDTHDTKVLRLRVRDLQLYPLPIIMDNMPTYSLLNVFHSGTSRMAVVVPLPERTGFPEINMSKTSGVLSSFQAPRWTATERTNNRIKSRLMHMNTQPDWTKDFLDGALAGIEKPKRHNVTGIVCDRPIGIITFKDIIDTVLQKKSYDEKEFYDHQDTSRTKSKELGDCGTISTLRQMVLHPMSETTMVPTCIRETNSSAFISKNNNTLRKRYPSNKATAAMDGADERSTDVAKEKRREYTGSSYTQNSQGGFHCMDDLSEINSQINPVSLPTSEETNDVRRAPTPTPVHPDSSPRQSACSLPSRKEASPFHPGESNPFTRRYVSALPNLPLVRRVTPFAREDCSSFAEKADTQHDGVVSKHEEIELIMPSSTLEYGWFGPNVSDIQTSDAGIEFSSNSLSAETHRPEDSGETLSISSCAHNDSNEYDIDDLSLRIGNTPCLTSSSVQIYSDRMEPEQGLDPNQSTFLRGSNNVDGPKSLRTKNHPQKVITPYQGFPPELLENNRENRISDFVSMTFPRTLGNGGLDPDDRWEADTPSKDGSFHDDRALLPSQRRALQSNAEIMGISQRRTSFWF